MEDSSKAKSKFRWIWPQGLSAQLVLILVLLLSLSMTVFTIHGILKQSQQREETMLLQAQVLARNLAATTADYLLVRDYTSIELSLIRSARFPGVFGIQVGDVDGKIVGDVINRGEEEPQPRYAQPQLIPPGKPVAKVIFENDMLVVWQPVVLGEHQGWIKIQYRLQEISDEISALWGENTLAGLVIVIIAGLLMTLLLRRPVADICSYTEFADQLVKCSGDQTQVVGYSIELSRLGTALNTASVRLKEQSNAIQTGVDDLTRMAAFVEHSPSLILSLDIDANVQYINPCGYRMLSNLGVDQDSQLELLLPPGIEFHAEDVVHSQKPKTDLEVKFLDRTFMWTLAPVRGQNIVHAYGEDVTERELAAEKAQTALVEKLTAESANKAKSQFLANMSHELRTPMNAILGYSQLLIEEAVDGGFEEIAPDLKKIEVAGKHLLTLINEILDLSKIEAGRMELYLENLDLDNLLSEVVSTARPLATQNNNEIEVNRSGKLGQVTSDATKLKQILFNLISNAIKFTKNGNISLYACFDKVSGQDWFTFEVQDTGIGMSEEQLARIFDPFAQADGSTTRKYGGTGLGLAITKRFCELLGGDVRVISAPGEGTTFSVHLPAEVIDNKADSDYRQIIQREISSNKLTERRRSASTVLVIDDDADIRNLVKIYLNKEGFNVETAADGLTGLELAKKVKPDVITLDVMMPGVGGWTVLKQLKEDPVLCDIPVAMLTMIEEKGLAFALGADDYLSKPIDWEEFINSIKKYARRKNRAPILLVTKDAGRRLEIRNTLDHQGYKVIEDNSAEAIDSLANNAAPSIIVLDFDNPVKEFDEISNLLRNDKRFSSIPVLMLFAKDTEEQGNTKILAPTEKVVLEHGDMNPLLDKVEALLKIVDAKHEAA